ncbi:MAG: hypothetical protein WCA21_13050 [Terracidiphilus sp.]
MKIENSGIIFITLCSRCGVDQMGSSEDWARSLGEEIEISTRVDREMAQTVAMNRDIEAEKMPLKWEELCTAFQSCCTAYNEQLRPERKLAGYRNGTNHFSVRPDALPEIVEASYDTKRIRIQTHGVSEWFIPHVILVGSGDVELISVSTRRAVPVDKIAQNAIREGLMSR